MFSVHHIALTVSNMQQSKKFYSLFGFKSVSDWTSENKDLSISHMALKNVILELFSYAEHIKPQSQSLEDNLRTLGVKHFGLSVNSINDARDTIISAGISKMEDIKINLGRTGILYFFIKDPDGNFIEFVEDKRNFFNI